MTIFLGTLLTIIALALTLLAGFFIPFVVFLGSIQRKPAWQWTVALGGFSVYLLILAGVWSVAITIWVKV